MTVAWYDWTFQDTTPLRVNETLTKAVAAGQVFPDGGVFEQPPYWINPLPDQNGEPPLALYVSVNDPSTPSL